MLMRTPAIRRAKPLGWDAPLARVLTPAGARLSTLRDAGAFLSEHFATVTQSAVLERAIELLMAAAESGAPEDRNSATDQVERVLHSRGLLGPINGDWRRVHPEPELQPSAPQHPPPPS